MLSSEFNQEMGALIRRLESRVNYDSDGIRYSDVEDAKDRVADAIVALVAVYLSL